MQQSDKKNLSVLMFGWEFPPYNSGGLGVACEGLSKAMSAGGIDLTFVLPFKVPIKATWCKFVFADSEKEDTSLTLVREMFAGYSSIVRDEKQALRRSWRATRGHTIRLFLLQLGCIIPALLGALLAALLGFIYPLAVVISTAGLFVSLLAYTQMAETEYAALVR